MAETKEIVLTSIGMDALKSGLDYLKTEKRSEITEKIKVARGFGDLSENAEYDEAKNEQAEVESKINQLTNMLKYTRIVEDDEIESDTVCLGNTIEIQEVGEDEIETYNIVSPDEIEVYALLNKDMDDVLLSVSSPVGKALLGRSIGDIVDVQVPDGVAKFEILEIRR